MKDAGVEFSWHACDCLTTVHVRLGVQVKKGTPLGKEMEGLMKEGKLVPTEVTVRLLRQAMQSSSNHKFLIDGFPRALDQAETFEQEVKPPELVLFFDCPEVRSSTCHRIIL